MKNQTELRKITQHTNTFDIIIRGPSR